MEMEGVFQRCSSHKNQAGEVEGLSFTALSGVFPRDTGDPSGE